MTLVYLFTPGTERLEMRDGVFTAQGYSNRIKISDPVLVLSG